ncbi:MAG: excinuclease ABC subunit UvrA [Flavobacteriales bacterium]|nr:excinuclease ABC subunit UvrA [Flavobacteriales bacterium]
MPENGFIEVFGAREHNLKNIDLKIPQNKLIVFTGLSGSGKSSLAFDTIFAEGQRRYIETFSSYVRQFIGGIDRPDVDKINGLSPVIAIEQKTVARSPRSTVGTITELYDFFRLLFARAATAISYETLEPMVKYSDEGIVNMIEKEFKDKRIAILAPKIKGRKGHYRELFEQILRNGYTKVRVDGKIQDIVKGMRLDRYKIHDIEVVIDRMQLSEMDSKRIYNSVVTAMKQGDSMIMVIDYDSGKFRNYSRSLMCPSSGISYPEPEPNLFSFNSPYGACGNCNGLGEVSEADIEKIIPDFSLSIKEGALSPLGDYKKSWIFDKLETILSKNNFSIKTPIREIDDELLKVILYGNEGMEVHQNDSSFRFEGIINFISRHSEESSAPIQRWALSFMNKICCPVCKGTRLKKEAHFFRIDNKHIGELASLDLKELSTWLNDIEKYLTKDQNKIATEIIKEIRSRLGFILDVGLDYLTLNRSSKSLSGGEAQRIRLATQIGTELMNVLYVLDEPSIGLHQRDNEKLIKSLKKLRDAGNTVLVVEHDKEMIQAADFIVDIGPKAGLHGGQIISAGTLKTILESDSLTALYLKEKKTIEIPEKRRKGNGSFLKLKGASGHNLKNVNLTVPLGTLTCVTGVSGSGKSSLINYTLYPILLKHIYKGVKNPLSYKSIEGLENLDKVIEINQSPIGRTPRSNPVTYTKVFDEIRTLYASLPESQIRGYKAGRFSFNVAGGKCETCNGGGLKLIEMSFLPDVYVQCETCNGKRYNRETLEVRYKGKSISDVLNFTIEEAVPFFENHPKIKRVLETLLSVGLGYIQLGQSSTTLSGGEAQRIKLSSELAKKGTGKTIYILDEPSTGLHFEDIRMLLEVVQRLVNEGNTVLIIEHNLDIIKVADYIIDLGLEGGGKGGQIIVEGSPEDIIKNKLSHTAKFLLEEMNVNKLPKNKKVKLTTS